MKSNKSNIGLRDIIIEQIRYLDTDDLVQLGGILAIILAILMIAVCVIYGSYKRQECINRIIEQYQSAPVEELKQRIELCNQ